MSSIQETIAAIRKELAELSGPIRCRPLDELANALLRLHWETGFGNDAGRPHLDAAIEALTELYGYLEPTDRVRAGAACKLGYTRGLRHLLHGSDDADRDVAISLLEESVDHDWLPPTVVVMAKVVLGWLYLTRTQGHFSTMGMSMSYQNVEPGALADVDRAIARFRQVMAGPVLSEDLRGMVDAMLAMAESMRDLLGMTTEGLAGLDFGRMQRMLAVLQTLSAKFDGGFGGGPGGPAAAPGLAGLAGSAGLAGPHRPVFLDPRLMLSLPPIDRPTTVMHGFPPASPPPAPATVPGTAQPSASVGVAPRSGVAPVGVAPVGVAQLREALAATLVHLAVAAGQPSVGDEPAEDQAYLAAAYLLRPDLPALSVEGIDEAVALATATVAETTAAATDTVQADPASAGVDRFLLAVALFLRGWYDGGGWGEDVGPAGPAGKGHFDADSPDEGSDLAAAAGQLLTAIEILPAEHPAALAAVAGLAAFVDEGHPLTGPLTATAKRTAEFADAVLAAAAAAEDAHRPGTEQTFGVARAVAALCRVTATSQAHSYIDAGELLAVAQAVPADSPWRSRLHSAVGIAAVAAGLAAEDPAAIRTATGMICATADAAPHARTSVPATLRTLAVIATALIDADQAALRRAVGQLADLPCGPADTRHVEAVLGALQLALAEPDTDTGSASVHLTRAVASLLTPPDAALRAASQWRLVEAYRRAGSPQDLQRARFTATVALRAGGNRADGPARYASWMLESGGAFEAFEALEVAAAASAATPTDRPTTVGGLDPLVRDVAGVLLAAARVDVPTEPATSGPATPPTPGEVAAALREVGANALLYLHPVDESRRRAGVLLLDEGGRLTLLGVTDVPDTTAEAPPVDWPDGSWNRLVEPLLSLLPTGVTPRRLLVAGTGPLGRLALATIPDRAGRPAGELLAVSRVASGRQVVELAARQPLPIGGQTVFVANPRGDRDTASYETMVLRRVFHPRSIGLGRTVEQVNGPGTPTEVLAYLPGPTGPGIGLLQLDCGVRAGWPPALALAEDPASGDSWLDVERILAQAAAGDDHATGGLVILPPDVDRSVRIAVTDVLLRAGVAGVIGWEWPVPRSVAALMTFVLHAKLTDEAVPPAEAVWRLQRWMSDPVRVAPRDLPANLVPVLRDGRLGEPACWAAVGYAGR
ncbi:hypothetical protein ACN27F_16045 [Solwaraspora sp. WMMB335]|uniref:hypothetical protein n=1 Tax=Solwaraspora sp. WMMB335 TaxID=3404118 RepID=UPI003B930475